MNLPLIGAAAVLLVIVLAQVIVSNQFAGSIEGLRRAAVNEQLPTSSDHQVLPEIMRAFAVRNGATIGGPMAILAHQSAEMRLGPDKAYFAITATQLSGTRQPAFVWDAWGMIAVIVPVHVVDSYVDGSGLLEARLAGSIRVSRGAGPESDKGEMMRFLSEMAWNPDAILNTSGLCWHQIDPQTVDVSAPTAGGIATVRYLFDTTGDIVGIEADDRPYVVDGKFVSTRWVGRFRDYAQFGNYRLPRRGEVAWVLPEGEFIYWRGQITKFEAQ
ncbi:hypothetical protein ABIB57_004899 [Devosia sp. UYZn731]|uniref:DUF6544 family protein n=1 Tax=Devosia sp. UYZn731 TaxID=3156345 RepID=UPI003396739D